MKLTMITLFLIGINASATNLRRQDSVIQWLNYHFNVNFIDQNYDLSDLMMDDSLALRDAYRAAKYSIPFVVVDRAVHSCDQVTIKCVEQHLPPAFANN